jgi:hypothetical protein
VDNQSKNGKPPDGFILSTPEDGSNGTHASIKGEDVRTMSARLVVGEDVWGLLVDGSGYYSNGTRRRVFVTLRGMMQRRSHRLSIRLVITYIFAFC